MKNITIKGFEHYLVDENGNVYNTKFKDKIFTNKPKSVKTHSNIKTGYIQIFLSNRKLFNKTKGMYVHRLVAELFVPNPLNLPEVNHKDFDKSNNNFKNLEWVTKKQNIYHTIKYKKSDGGKVYNSILNDKILLKNGIELYKKYGRLKDVASYWKVSSPTAKKILKSLNIKIHNGKQNVPTYIKDEIKEMCLSNINLKAKDINNHLLKKHNITLTRQYLNQIIKNQKNINSIKEKNIIKKTILDFSNNIYQ